MSRVYICHYAEIGLKGRNRSMFEDKLKQNIKSALKRTIPNQNYKLRTASKRIVLEFSESAEPEPVSEALGQVFGLVNYSPAHQTGNHPDEIKAKCLELLEKQTFESFAIRAKRSNKHVPFTSGELNRTIGAAVVEKLGKKVNLTHPDLTCFVEILDDKSFVMAERIPGLGGLPAGSSGKTLALLSGGIDSPVAAYYAIKRGAFCEFIHFHVFPYTNKRSQEKVIELARVLEKYQFKTRLFMVPFAQTQEDIVMNCPDRLRIVLYRRFMMRIAGLLARRRRIRAVVTGESLGQVASQTLANMAAVEEAIRLPVLRPLIGMDKNEIMDTARRIGTYDISIQPHDDACTRFMPQHPIIHAHVKEVLEAEKELDIDGLVARDLAAMEVMEFSC